MIVCGIDPGQTGALAIIHHDGKTVELFDTPIITTTVIRNKKKYNHSEYSETEMASLFSKNPPILEAISTGTIHVFIEKVHSMPKQGVASTFNFGMGYGIWLGVLAALKIPSTRVTPQSWKHALMQGIADKDAARLRAMQLYPQCTDQLKRKCDIGRADALLISHWGKAEGSK